MAEDIQPRAQLAAVPLSPGRLEGWWSCTFPQTFRVGIKSRRVDGGEM